MGDGGQSRRTAAPKCRSPKNGLWRTGLACLSVLLSAAIATAQPDPLRDTVTVTASAEPVPFENLARAVTVLTREQIERLPAHSIAEILRYAVGADVRARAPFGVQSDFSMRGASFGQTLVLVDGLRLNDAQTGHHNGDIPVPLEDIERIEILPGAGSAIHGADAFGGTINVITRTRGGGARASIAAGGFGLVRGAARWTGTGSTQPSLAVEAARSSGFMFARDFGVLSASGGFASEDGMRVRVGHVRKEFGANGFYGPSPSREWTDQTLVTAEREIADTSRWRARAVASYRTHGDRFLWDMRQPGLFENRHRTHAVLLASTVGRTLGTRSRLTVGAETGADWIRSGNLGDHGFARTGVYVSLERALGRTAVLYPGVRYDYYSSFGGAWSPALSGSVWLAPALRARGAVGRAYRIPTFTELYYRDPAHRASGHLRPETAWNLEGGADWFITPRWIGSATTFSRSEKDVIDWARETAAEPWRTTNIHRLRTAGVELEVRRRIGSGGFIGAQYARLSSDPGQVHALSKYVLDYARDALSLQASATLPGAIDLGQRLAFTRRSDGRRYRVVDVRISRAFGTARLFVEGTNLLDTRYQEVIGVDMPGRWISAGIAIGAGR